MPATAAPALPQHILAPQSRILLASMKDEYYISEFLSSLYDVVEKLRFSGMTGHHSTVSSWPLPFDPPELQLFSKIVYYTVTGMVRIHHSCYIDIDIDER
jgi:hypothetical protein